MGTLCISLLGAFRASLDGKPVTAFGTDKARALLAYLAVESNRPHHREHLASLLWSDQSEQKALHNLRQSLSSLRKIIPQDNHLPGYLFVERDTIQFNPDSDYWLDVAEFQAAIENGKNQKQNNHVKSRSNIRKIQYAISLYQGNFLDQLNLRGSPLFDEWAILHRERLTRQAVEAMSVLIDYHERRGDFEQACKVAERIVSLVPWEEHAHQIVLRMLGQTGQWSAAEIQYQNIQRILDEELGVEPASETTVLIEDIRTSARLNTYLEPRHPISPNNLTVDFSPFVGRESELEKLSDLLASSECRLITLVGPGGVGKSRLAYQVALEHIGLFENGIFFVPLATIENADLLTTAIAEAIGFSFYSSQNPTTLLIDHLRQKNMLLILDNLEHILPNGADQIQDLITNILTNATDVYFLATSRQPLNLRCEQIFDVDGLSFPMVNTTVEQTEDLANFSAVKLFYQIAKRVNPRFSENELQAQIIKICQLVNGLPLGIELSASWARDYTANEIAAQIEQDLDFLATAMRDVPDRHRSLRAVFNHSWQLLNATEKGVFQKLAIFNGSFSQAAAKNIAYASTSQLNSFINQSLLKRIGEDRYDIHNLLKQFIGEILSQNQEDEQFVRREHSSYYAKLVRQQEAALFGKDPINAQNIISADIDNIRKSWQEACDSRDLEAIALSAKGLSRYYDMRGWFNEGRDAFSYAVQCIKDISDNGEKFSLLAILATQLSWFESQLGNFQAAKQNINEILPDIRSNCPKELPAVLNMLGNAAYDISDYDQATIFFNECLDEANQSNALAEIAFANNYLGNICRIQGNFSEAKSWYEKGLSGYQQLEDIRGLASSLNNLGSMAGISGDYAEAEKYFQESLLLRKAMNDQSGIAGCLHNLSTIAYINKDFIKTKDLRLECLAICEEIGYTWGISTTLKHLGDVYKALGDLSTAKKCYLDSMNISESAKSPRITAFTFTSLGNLAIQQKDFPEANRFFRNALQLAKELELTPLILDILLGYAELWLCEGHPEKADHLISDVMGHPGIEKQTLDKGELVRDLIKAEVSSSELIQFNTSYQNKPIDQAITQILGD